jgi:hypothetical protein
MLRKYVVLFVLMTSLWGTVASGLEVATFDMDASPPVGTELAYDTTIRQWDLGLRAKGMVLLGAGDPVVLCALDWIGIGNGAHMAFRVALAEAAGTTVERVAVHTLHQHDAPTADFSAEAILKGENIDLHQHDGTFPRQLIARLKGRVRGALDSAQTVTHVGTGSAEVFKVASIRRLLDENGKVRAMRFTTCKDPEMRAEPEGVIDPMVTLVSLWNDEKPVVVMSYYAVHPQSYYRTGVANPDFPGVARFLRQLAVPDALHIHFSGAGGNLGAGKYNDGAHENRLILAERMADGMRRAWEATERAPLTAEAVQWNSVPVAFPPAPHLNVETLEAVIKTDEDTGARHAAARNLAWLRRCQAGDAVDVSCLALGKARLLHLPGELFVEYQLAAKAARPDLAVSMAAYGDYAPGYIGTTHAYTQGGYETSERASRVAPETEAVLMNAIHALLGVEN